MRGNFKNLIFILFLLWTILLHEDDRVTVSGAHYKVENGDELHAEPTQLTHCYGGRKKPLTLVSTLDGRFIALDSYSGKLKWSLPDTSGPLLSSSLSSIKNEKNLGRLKLVPSLDGGLFQIRGDKIETVPLSADLLLGKFQTLSDGSHIVGGRDTKSYGIDCETGKLIYKCSMDGCKPVSKGTELADKDVFVLRRTQQIVRAVDQRSGEEKWNFSVGSYDVSLMEAVNHRHGNCDMYAERKSLQIRMDVADGYVEALKNNPSESVEWSFRFDAPIAAVWKFHHNKLQPVDIFRHGILQDPSNEKFAEDSILYLGMHEGQMYAQSFDAPPQSLPGLETPNEPTIDSHEVAVLEQPYVGTWRPYMSSSPSRTAALMNGNGLSVLNQLDYPFDNGFCMIALKRISSLKQLNRTKPSPFDANKTLSDVKEADVISVSVTERWKEILVLVVLISAFLQLTIFRLIRRRWMRDLTLKSQADNDVIKRVRSVTSHVSTSTETAQASGNANFPRVASTEEFSSRYLSDFEHLECIGKGGFGVVFKARNKIDGCEYAVKRIYLPNCNEAREKVTREVKAMAKLDYPGIVRFYYSWWETPPVDWQEQNDRTILMRNVPGGPAVGLSKQWYVHIQSDEEDAFDRDEASSESGITIKRRRNKSSMSFNSKGSSKSIGDDPLGKKINNIAEIGDELINIDLKEHNDVFIDDASSDDSFNVEFKDSSCSENGNNDSDFEDNGIEDISLEELNKPMTDLKCSKESTQTDDSLSAGNCSVAKCLNSDVRSLKSRLSTKLVGRCCCRSESCITAPPVYLYIQMQLCMSNTLKDWLNENVGSRERSCSMDIFKQILDAVEYCHNQGMMHRDLKPSNIFFAADGSIKIGDFGLVTAITMPSNGQVSTSPMDENHTGNVGTHLYMSPEQVRGKVYNHKVDIYSLGLILFELLRPFSTQMERIKTLMEVKQNRFPRDFEKVYKTEVKVLKWFLREDPLQRPEAKEFKDCELFDKLLKKSS